MSNLGLKDMFLLQITSQSPSICFPNKKLSNWNNNQNDYSSLSDSQFLFGSQFCPENSETLSAPLDFGAHLRHSKQSQQNSLEGEPSIFTKYQTKPQLFGGDIKDGGLFPPPLSVGKSKGLLEQFEEKKKRAKDKYDSETLYNFVSNVRESIHRLQTSVEKSEEHLSSRSQSILDSLETVAKTCECLMFEVSAEGTVQETVQAQNDLVFEAVQDKGNMEQAILEMKKRSEARQAEFIEMKSNLKHLEVLVAQQSQEFQQLCDQLGQLNVPSVLAELKRLISVPPVPGHVKDSASQTSPPLAQSLNLTGQEKYTFEKPVLWQAQALPAAWNPGMGSLQPGEFGVWGEGAKNDALQEEAALPAFGSHERNRHVKDKAVQTNCKNWAVTKTDAKNCGSSIQGHKIPSDRDLVSQGASELTSLEINNFSTSIKNACQKYQAQRMCVPSKSHYGGVEFSWNTYGRAARHQPKLLSLSFPDQGPPVACREPQAITATLSEAKEVKPRWQNFEASSLMFIPSPSQAVWDQAISSYLREEKV
ncbi:interactor of HORMAD1 protein 1 isoform X9 [Macaca nemestrina]|uniref:interactor of HORMAD1 protein 1 isoform X9 n=1 Tax=Macaca nemestrina TaxID=9545 RepID=UPI0039B93787